MRLIVGLGNPGDNYRHTRHNAGFLVIDKICRILKTDLNKSKFNGNFVKMEDLVIAKPMTYMNLSGNFIKEIMDFYKINPEDVLVIYDEKDYEIGTSSIKIGGSAAGHNGIKSIIDALKNNSFKKLRIGIGKPKTGYHIKDYVLGNFSVEEMTLLEPILDLAAEAAISFAYNDINIVMNKYNVLRRKND
ncbi:aminoacyl-tRNA hydrolase [Mycoplasmopsis alligatoris]|uniref:Peptidyl-tRNA hydrolase n=1 Tax=Mycoplasmopsis alligatoris A21JP2 TaxID=747682 RepID=D4XWH7_9BACT|nr:aminoacyl-tRNA hydrolase [Mycoplasmopsis alligatoris]EFF41225.1 aminoacyl-tRNA hydrolase [Mycoplasmopsis alligatoris A21JP2]